MKPSPWIEPFLATLHCRHSTTGKEVCVRGVVVRVGRCEILFQTFETGISNLVPVHVVWGLSSSRIRVRGLELGGEGKYGAKFFKLFVGETPDRVVFESRKNEQCAMALLFDGQDRLSKDLEPVNLPYVSLMDVRPIDECCQKTLFLDKVISCPIYIAGMTGGSAETDRINQKLAKAAAVARIPLAVGSQRGDLMPVSGRSRKRARLRSYLPFPEDLPLIGNIGVSEVLDQGPQVLKRLAQKTGVDAICIHLNILQELIQWDGQKTFKNVFLRLEEAVVSSEVPIILKETGTGFCPETFERLLTWPIQGIEMTSRAGPNWAGLEGLREDRKMFRRLGQDFSVVGHEARSQLDLVLTFRARHPRPKMIASGGIVKGIHVAKWLFAGADLCSIGRGVLRVLFEGDGQVGPVVDYLDYLKKSVWLGLVLTQKRRLEGFVGSWQP